MRMTNEFDVLCAYIKDELGYEGEIDLDMDLLENEVIDSFSIVQLAVFIQEKFEIELDADDLVRDNLARLSSIVALIERKRSTGIS